MVTIYGLVCPIAGEIRYIGKTRRSVKARLIAHLQESKKGHSHKQRWLARCLASGLRPSIWILEQVPAGLSWQDRERAWIRRALEMGLDLTNQTAGGEGLDFLDEEARASYSKTLSETVKKWQKKSPEKLARLREGARRSWAENKAARLAACRDGWTDESRAQHRATMARISKTPEFKAAMSDGQKASWARDRDARLTPLLSPECRANKSRAAKAGWADPVKRAAKLSGRWTPEARAKQAAEIASRREKMGIAPESRKKQGAAMKEFWARRKAMGYNKLGGG